MAAAMAPASFGPLLLIAVTMGLLALPVTPALYELHKREDASPLPTSRHDGRITNFAESLRSRLEPLRSELRACRLNRELSYSSVKGMKVLVVGSEEFDFDPAAAKDVAVVMCSRKCNHSAESSGGRRYLHRRGTGLGRGINLASGSSGR